MTLLLMVLMVLAGLAAGAAGGAAVGVKIGGAALGNDIAAAMGGLFGLSAVAPAAVLAALIHRLL